VASRVYASEEHDAEDGEGVGVSLDDFASLCICLYDTLT